MLAAMTRTNIGSTMIRGLPAAVVLAAALAGPGRGAMGAEVTSSSAAAASTPGLKLVKPTERTGIVPGTVIAVLSGTSVTGKSLRRDSELRAPRTSDAVVNTVLSGLGATSIEPLFGRLPAATTRALASAARAQIGASALNLADVVVIHLTKAGAAVAARKLAATSGISFAEPDRYVQTMDTGGQVLTAGKQMGTDLRVVTTGPSLLPTNFGFRSSLESYLNAQGVDAGGAFAALQEKYRQLPGTGETITNVSVGDLTDASMHDAEVATYGPTTVVRHGQRYLDLPTMPLIPAYVAKPDGSLSRTAAVEGTGDPVLSEIGLDFSVMAPLPDADQRPRHTGSGFTDLLGIAPGAKYRLVVPARPTTSQIARAFVAAATQEPRPDVITASLGYGTDVAGFPGRYLEDDPLMESVIAGIVRHYRITVVDSANDGTRLFTPAAIGPDGGATPTDLARTAATATSIDDDQYSTTPSKVLNTGSIDAGATTTDDTLAIPPQGGGNAWRNPAYAQTRTDGGGNFASGWGQRVTLSAPGDNIPAFAHSGPNAGSVAVVLNGGTSASAPEIAAAAADVLQAARLTHRKLDPAQVIRILQETGRRVATPPQADQHLNVGPQIDVTAAIDAVLRAGHASLASTSIARLSVAHHVDISSTGAAFTDYTNPRRLDLADPTAGSAYGMTGAGATGPVTFAADITGPRGNNYMLVVGRKAFANTSDYIRITPAELLAAAGHPLKSRSRRTVTVSYQVRHDRHVLAQIRETLTVGPYNGTSTVAPAPVIRQVVFSGQAVKVSYDLTGVSDVANPELVVSAAGHWNPLLGPVFNSAYSQRLPGRAGIVNLPASAFADGGGIYGVGIEQDSKNGVYGIFAPVRVTGFPVRFTPVPRPPAPLLSTAGTPGRPSCHG